MIAPIQFTRIEPACTWILEQLGQSLVVAMPLGLGKPNQLINALYQRVKADRKRELRIFTALSLNPPTAHSNLERRFLEPFSARHWGADYPALNYLEDLARDDLPANIRVHEFYLQAGKALSWPRVQRDYVSVNYTHVPYALADHGVAAILQLVAQKPGRPGFYSLSCNPDLTLDIVDLYRQRGRSLLMIAVVHPDLPYCAADAEVPATFFSAVVESPEVRHQLFALPRQAVAPADYLIGLQASLMIEDGGTLQIGIGSLSEALVHCTLLRQNHNELYREIANRWLVQRPVARRGEKFFLEPLREGLYGTSEMVMDGFMHLRRGGVLNREIFDLEAHVRRYLHGAFFLGSKVFYEWLRELDRAGDTGLCMTRVSKVNDLYDANEMALRRQRVKARFFNTCLGVTVLGGAASDTQENGQVVSGVGGQYNFVAMSHELPDSFSVLMFRALRDGGQSNVQWGHGQLTIPRHLRDTVISEYGLGFLKNRCDEEVIQAVLSLTDARFQEPLRRQAVAAGKLNKRWRVPHWAEGNNAEFAAAFLQPWHAEFPSYPFGSDFSPVEEQLVRGLVRLKRSSKVSLFKLFHKGLFTNSVPFRLALERMELATPRSFEERAYRVLLLGALSVE